MSLRRVLLVVAALMLVETGVFAMYYDDLLYLRQPLPVIEAGPSDTFSRHADEALSRRHLTRRHLETLADAARGFGLVDPERQALERLLADDPTDRSVRLRLADALRRSGEYSRAETLYLEVLESTR